jgi:cellulose synthase/poly-beta-1,6-N-acetylglucosamine synthase-like glycosyltransferase
MGPLLHTALTGAILAFWSLGLLLLWHHRSCYPRLAHVRLDSDRADPLPTVSVVVPACNEEDTIEPAMRSLLALDYPHLEIIAIDDRSTDGTGGLLDCLAAGNPRLRVRHIRELPSGWLGKNHALHVAAREARGDWILFTDADVVYRPDAMRKSVEYARRTETDHLVACPHFVGLDFWERLIASYFGLMFALRVRPWDVARPGRAAYFGFGAFNLVRTEAYCKSGGYGALPMEVVDDAKLGRILKRSGFRTRIVDASDLISLRWFTGLRGAMSVFVKNAFASFDFSLVRTAAAFFGIALTAVYPVFALIAPVAPARLLAAATLAAMVCGAAAMRRVTDADARYGLAYPLAGLVVMAIIAQSTWVTLTQRGIVWRGTRYPLDALKRGIV